MMSCVFSTSLAISGEDTTMVESAPSFMCMRGPYWCESFVRPWWGIAPSWCKFPIRGSFGGPGGNLEFEGLVFVLQNKLNTVNMKRKMGRIASEGIFWWPKSMVDLWRKTSYHLRFFVAELNMRILDTDWYG